MSSIPNPLALVRRVADVYRRRGPGAVLRGIVTNLVYASETQIWFEADLTKERGEVTSVDVEEAGDELLPAALAVQDTNTEVLDERRAGRARAWVGKVEGAVGFVCWTFAERTPVLAARGGWLAMPPGVECLEDSLTAPEFRGRGLAPKVWAVVEDRRADDGVNSLITKVEVENVASCRAVARAGFRHVATMRFTRFGPFSRVRISAAPNGIGPHLVAELER